MSLPTSTMETLLLEDLSCWDPIEDLQLTEELFPSMVLNNLDNELGLGSENQAKDPFEKKIGPLELDLPLSFSEIDFQNGLDDWMEEKMDITSVLDVELLEHNGDHLALEKLCTGIISTTDSPEGVTETGSTLTVSSVEVPPDVTKFTLTPPESPQNIQIEIITCNNIDTNSVSGASTEEVLVSVTPPDTPPDYLNILVTNSSPSSPELKPNLKPNRKRKHSTKPHENSKGDHAIKKLRKRDQNRDAATRYRMKKRAENENLASQEFVLQEKNKELKDRVDSLSSEVKYLKNLLKEIILAKMK